MILDDPRSLLAAVLLAGLVLGGSDPVHAQSAGQSPAEQRGMTFMRANCSRCHAITKVGESPLKIAPPFRTLHLRYPVESLAEALAEGIVTGHPSMPEFRLDTGQIADVIAYLKSLER
jgi:mono/diheme cytochrome c family protein